MKKIVPLSQPINASVIIPGSLSYTIRALNLAAMTPTPVTLYNPLFSDDTGAMIHCLQTLGVMIGTGPDFITVYGNIFDIKDQEYTLNINISGRTARTLLALLCVVPGIKILTCESGFKKRPIGEMVHGLRQLGATIEYLENEGYLPVKISSSKLHPGKVTMSGSLSSQYFSGIMMIAPLVGRIEIEVQDEQASKPFIDVTIATMKEFGVKVQNNDYQRYIIEDGQSYSQSIYEIEADAISASYFWGIAAITQSTIRVLHLSPDSFQGDVKFADILQEMGCTVIKNKDEKWVQVTGPKELKGITMDMNDTPDSVQTLAVVAAYAKGITHITGLKHLKVKETDRIEAPKNELVKMGITVSSTDDSITITGGTPHGAEIQTYGDHRMAMSFAVAGARTPGITIANPEVVSKSFPTFWKMFIDLGIQLPITHYKNCIICGFRATGKTSIGHLVAQALGWNYIEMDYLISNQAGKPIVEITKNGTNWHEFRERETELLTEVLDMEKTIISAGGGVGVNDHINQKTKKTFGEEQTNILKKSSNSKIIVLTASPSVIAQRLQSDEEKKEIIQRPLLNEKDAKHIDVDSLSREDHIKKVVEDTLQTFKTREPLYKALSDSIIDTSSISLEEAAANIIALLKK